MSSLPTDFALTLAGAGIDIHLDEDDLERALSSAIADRRGYLGEISMTETGYSVELLTPHLMTFEGRTQERALAWCLIFLMGETGEIGIGGFAV